MSLYSGNEIGPFRAVEESTLAHLSPAAVRSDIFAWYSLIGTAGTAFGMMACGWVVHTLQASKGWSAVRAYRTIFFVYAVIGLIKFLLACSLSRNCEAEKKVTPARDTETAPLLGDNRLKAKKSKPGRSLLPSISKESRVIVLNLCILFALDAFASGLAPLYIFANSYNDSVNC
jgi:MFS family permease